MVHKSGKTISLAAVLVILGLFLSGCDLLGTKDEPVPEFKQENHLAVHSDLSISATLVEPFAESYYRPDELLSMINEEAKAFNAEMGAGAMLAERVEAEQGLVNAVMRFAGREAYARYNEAIFFVGTVDEAINNGLLRDQTLFGIGDREKTIDREGLAALKNTYIIVTDEHNRIGPLTISAFGKIQYVSGGVERWYDSYSVRVALPSEGFVFVVFKP
jgi:hypothetical protein